MASVHTGSRTDIHHVIGSANGVFIVFNNHQRVPKITKTLKGGEQAVIVPLVQTNARFIEHVEHSGETGTDLGRQTDSLRFTTGQGHRRPIEAQIVQTDIQQKAQSHADLAQHEVSDLHLTVREQWFTALEGTLTH